MNRRLVEDRRWNTFHGIVFSQSRRLRYSAPSSAGDTDSLNSGSDRTTYLSSHRSSSENATGSSSPKVQSPGAFSYPDISLSLSAEAKDGLSPSFPSHSSKALWTGATQAEHVQRTSTAHSGCADTSSVPDMPFRSPRGFHIPRDKLRDALDAGAGSVASYWQYTLYQGPKGEKVKLHYCKNKETTEAVSKLFVNEPVIGCDIEWSAQAKSSDGIKKNVALIQIACEERIALFHIARYPGGEIVDDLVSPTLKLILESPKITKAGVAIKGDCTRLKNFLGIHCQGLFELSYLHKLVNYCSGNIDKVDRRFVRLADQVQEHLKLPLLKGDVQTSDWGRDLDYQQTQYAASDSYAALQLFFVMEEKRRTFSPVPPRPAHAELNLAISLGDQARPTQPIDCSEDGGASDDSASVSSSEISIEELARDYFHVSSDDSTQVKSRTTECLATGGNTMQTPRTNSIPSISQSSNARSIEEMRKNLVGSPELELANEFASTFSPQSNRRVGPQALRAYSLWHKQGLNIPAIASILRQPPIQDRTVITYICDAISIERLNFEAGKVLEFTTQYSYQPFIKAHKDLFERARKEVWRVRTIEVRRASGEH